MNLFEVGWIFMGAAVLIASLNSYLSFVRPLYFRVTKKPYRFASGIPGLGTLSLIIATILLPKDFTLMALVTLVIFADTAGIPYFAAAMLFDWRQNRRKLN